MSGPQKLAKWQQKLVKVCYKDALSQMELSTGGWRRSSLWTEKLTGFLSFSDKSRDNSAGIATGWTARVRFQEFSLLHVVQTGSVAHSASYPMGTGGSSPGGKSARPLS
jgi:hypothetical protein